MRLGAECGVASALAELSAEGGDAAVLRWGGRATDGEHSDENGSCRIWDEGVKEGKEQESRVSSLQGRDHAWRNVDDMRVPWRVAGSESLTSYQHR